MFLKYLIIISFCFVLIANAYSADQVEFVEVDLLKNENAKDLNNIFFLVHKETLLLTTDWKSLTDLNPKSVL